MNSSRSFAVLSSILAVAMTLVVSGCTAKFGMWQTNSRFVYPNSNVEPLGHVTAENSKTGFIVTPIFDAKFINETVEKALKEKGGDILLNYKLTFSMTAYPFFINVSTVKVDGTAAKMTVGKQELH